MDQLQYAEQIRDRVKSIPTLLTDPSTPLQLDGKTYTLEFDNRAVKEILKQLSINILGGDTILEVLEDPEAMTKLLVIGFKRHHPDITEEEVDRINTLKYYHYIRNGLLQALTAFFPDTSDIPKPDGGSAPANGQDPQ